MNRYLHLFILATLIFSPFLEQLYAQQNSQQEKRLALIIGNGNYVSGSPLANPENDARAMKKVLQQAGFEVVEFENLSQSHMKKEIDDFGMRLKNYDVGLFFYAGHGIQSRGVNYLIPVDAQIKTEAQVEYDCVQADRVVSLMEESGAKVKIIVLDACRNNPFERSWTRSVTGKGLASMNAPSGTLIAYATSPGSTASDGSGENGLYTSAILENILNPNSTILQMFQNVRATVSQKSSKEQTPWESTSLVGDFYFLKSDGKIIDNVDITSKKSISPNYFEIPPGGVIITSLMKKEYKRIKSGVSVSDTILQVTLNQGKNSRINKTSTLKVYSPAYEKSTITGADEYTKDRVIGTIFVENSFRDKSEGELILKKDKSPNEFKYYESYAKVKNIRHSIFLSSGFPISGNIDDNSGRRLEILNVGYIFEWVIGAYVSIGLINYTSMEYDYSASPYQSEKVSWSMQSIRTGLTKSFGKKFNFGGGISMAWTPVDYSMYHDYYRFVTSIELLCRSHFKSDFFLLYGISLGIDGGGVLMPFGIGYSF